MCKISGVKFSSKFFSSIKGTASKKISRNVTIYGLYDRAILSDVMNQKVMNQNSIRLTQQDGKAGQLKTFGRKITILDFEVKYQAFY